MSLKGRKVIIGLTGGIACYKVPYLVRYLVKDGAEVRVVMTEHATKFITPLTMETVSRHPVYYDMFADREYVSTQHIELAHWADLFVIAPATANVMAKMAHGICDDLLTTVICATGKPVMFAPAMNPGMWQNRVTQRNLQILKDLGYQFIGPAEGEMAEKQIGWGRMVEPLELFEAVKQFFAAGSKKKVLKGRNILVTAGPCREAIDPVRFISNRSSGKMGFAIAQAALDLGAHVTLVSGPTSLTPPAGADFTSVETTAQMHKAVADAFAKVDCLVMAAAPSDFTPRAVAKHKIKRGTTKLELTLEPTADILKDIARLKKPRQIVIGFALETEHEEEHARKKLVEKRLDMIVVNNPRNRGAAFEHDTNQVTLIRPRRKPERWPLMSKEEVARRLTDEVAVMLAGKKG
ncbi:bifunctional phosphopantothenoylcysteine decarboxylase/phosphopantothenate--cysteine ligase CoaBC [candidate division GN15 bacterium]|uniref:Coenzyme A biosynthesis bifunctional protein CoaBC n=1 Tax=candidate division GN15 bacterium TaxID=2072418 RepID=A0A855X862_9BACT|nr:MAG: bifunctional phosphopantothenoylcysteine decarboxylase/phosphopantothenate--cysteine ligase CoaBC [candidate division GN15 bacterium]